MFATQLGSAGGQSSAELIWSANLLRMLQPGLRAAAIAALDMAIIGAGNFLAVHSYRICSDGRDAVGAFATC